MPDFDDLLTADQDWLRSFSASLKILEDWSVGQLALWAVDDLLAAKAYIACPQRGLHVRLVECWVCWCDVAYGYATASQVLAPGHVGGGE